MEKYSLTKPSNTSTSPLGKLNDLELDPYSPVIVEDLLQGVNEWRNIQDIIRLTFKALTDVVKAQGETIRELEKIMPTRASKTELNTGLSLKANVNDVSRTINEISASLDSKIGFDDIQSLLKDYVLRSDLQYLMSGKVSLEEIRPLLESKVSVHDVKSELSSLAGKIEESQRDFFKKVNTMASQRELQQLQEQLDQKANIADMNEALESKANKQSVANALHRKANRSDIDTILNKKADLSDLQGIIQALDNKAEVRTIEKLTDIIDNKIDRQEIGELMSKMEENAKITQKELDNMESEIRSQRSENEQREAKRMEVFRQEIDLFKDQLQALVSKKPESRDLDRLASLVNTKLDLEQLSETLTTMKNEIYEDLVILKNEINMQRTYIDESLNERFHKTEQQRDEEITRITERLKILMEDRQTDIDETAKFVKQLTSNTRKDMEKDLIKLLEDFEGLRKTMEELLNKKLDKKELIEFRGKVLKDLEQKVDLAEVQAALNSSQSDISTRFIEFKEEIKTVIRGHENEVFGLMNKKANVADINSALAAKADNNLVQSLINQKLSTSEFDDVRKLVERMARELDEKPNVREYEKQISVMQNQLSEIAKEQLLKANIKDVCTLLDTKSSKKLNNLTERSSAVTFTDIEDVNKALTEIHKELDTKSNLEDFNTYINDQAIINESLCSENIVGRWTWKSGELKSGSTVPWESQVVNTLPDNFLWEKDKSSILTVAAGLYEITFGFFAKKKPTVQLLINGEPIISAVNNASYVIHHSSGKLKDVKHPYGNITGLTMIDYIVLPARARLSFTYSGEIGGEGFFGLKRL